MKRHLKHGYISIIRNLLQRKKNCKNQNIIALNKCRQFYIMRY